MSADEVKKLLELAQKNTSKEEVILQESKPEILRFINELNIQDGDVKIPNSKIYFLYTLWNPKRTRMNDIQFFTSFKKCFKSYARPYERGYYLNQTPFKLTEEQQKLYDKQQEEREIRNRKRRNRLFSQKIKAEKEAAKKNSGS